MGRGKNKAVRESKLACDQHDGDLVYAGIGARKTPPEIQNQMRDIAAVLSARKWHLRTGGADGADNAFWLGSAKAHTLYLPWNGFNGHRQSLYGFKKMHMDNCGITVLQQIEALLMELYPNFHTRSEAVKRLHIRNGLIMLGHNLSPKSKMVICWTPNGEKIGGTGIAISLANYYRIPVFNLAEERATEKLSNFVQEQENKHK